MNEREVFIEALQKGSRAQQLEYLSKACGGDETLKKQVESLLEAHERVGTFLQEPVFCNLEASGDLHDQPVLAQLAENGCRESETPQFQETSCRARSVVEKSTDTHDDIPSLEFLVPPQKPDELGRLGHYRLLRLLGHGGMGMVFQAQDIQLQRQVALKVLRPELAANPNSRQRFLREGRAAAQIHSDHVVNIFLVDQEGELPYLVMEMLQGQSLAEKLEQKGQLPVGECLKIARETAVGLAAAHASGLIHRDIKPANIWLEEPSGRVKLLDFGLARSRTGPLLTQRHIILGTPAYMAPEQAAGLPLDERCDLFSLGAVLYHILTGRQPFAGEDLMAVLSSLATATIPPAKDLVPGLPERVSELLDRLLARDPAERPGSAMEVVHTLQMLEQEVVGLAPPSAHFQEPIHVDAKITPAAVPSSRGRRWVLLGGLLVVGMAAALFLFPQVLSDRKETDSKTADEEPISPSSPVTAPATPDLPAATEVIPPREFTLTRQNSLHYSQIQSLAFTSDSKTLVSAEYLQGQVIFWDLLRREKMFHIFTVAGGSLDTIALDPHNRWLAISPMSSIGKKYPGIRIFSIEERKQIGELKGHTDRVVQMAFLKDGKTLLSTGFDGSIRRWDVQMQQEGKPLRSTGPRLDYLDVWEDGKGSLRLGLSGEHHVWSDNVELEKLPYTPGRVSQSPDGKKLACSKQDRVESPKMSYVSLWKLPEKTLLGELPEAPKAEGLAFTSDNKHVVVMGSKYTCIYETDSRKQVARIEHTERAVSLAVSTDGRWLAIGTLNGTVRVWSFQSLLAPTS
jgi:serine/threonine protein kinase